MCYSNEIDVWQEAFERKQQEFRQYLEEVYWPKLAKAFDRAIKEGTTLNDAMQKEGD